jgi:hypothetical protein
MLNRSEWKLDIEYHKLIMQARHIKNKDKRELRIKQLQKELKELKSYI